MFRSPRHVAPALVVATLTLTGCGGGLMTDGSKAASYGDTTVTTQQVQDALSDLTKASPGGVDGQTVAVFLALRPQLTALAGRYGIGVSRDQAADSLTSVPDPSAAAIDTVQSNNALAALREDPRSQAAVQRLINEADIDLNPRYGTWVKGHGPGEPAAKNNWLARVAATPTPTPAS